MSRVEVIMMEFLFIYLLFSILGHSFILTMTDDLIILIPMVPSLISSHHIHFFSRNLFSFLINHHHHLLLLFFYLTIPIITLQQISFSFIIIFLDHNCIQFNIKLFHTLLLFTYIYIYVRIWLEWVEIFHFLIGLGVSIY